MSEHTDTDVTVIGAGPGGYAAAFMAADLGQSVTLVDLERNPGGVCLYRGCIPSKALLHVAQIINDAKEAEHWGVRYAKPRIDFDRLRAAKDEVVTKMTGGLGQLCKARNIAFVQGRAYFEDSTTIRVTAESGAERRIKTKHTILATGSRPATIPGIDIESDNLMNSTGALEIADIPKTLLIVGGGYIGLELGTVYATLGSKVTVVEMTPSLLPGADSDLIEPLAVRVERLMHEVLLNTRVTGMAEADGGIKVSMTLESGKRRTRTFNKVLVSIGRKPNSSGLGLGNTQAEIDKHGFVTIDGQRRTTDPNIFAIGDVAGEPMLAHKASHEGRVAAEVISGERVAFEPNAIPAVVFTNPEVAWCGVTETQAKRDGIPINVSRFPWTASGRATTLNRTDGLTKLITDPETHQVIGMGIVGTGAGELISQGVIAIEMGATAADVGLSIHPHPTLSETIMESADMIFGHSTHIYRPRKKK